MLRLWLNSEYLMMICLLCKSTCYQEPILFVRHSCRYGMTVMRAKAVLLLGRLRAEMMEKLVPIEQSVEEGWDSIYDLHLENPTENNAENLSAQFGLKIDHVRDILSRMTSHRLRLSNDEAARAYYADQIKYVFFVSVYHIWSSILRKSISLPLIWFSHFFLVSGGCRSWQWILLSRKSDQTTKSRGLTFLSFSGTMILKKRRKNFVRKSLTLPVRVHLSNSLLSWSREK